MSLSKLGVAREDHGPGRNIMNILKKKPDLIDLMSVLSEIRSEWATIGTSLNVPDQGLLHLNISDSGKLNATLQAWIDGYDKYSPVLWETVLNAIGGPIVNNERISHKIRSYLCKDEIYLKYIERHDFTIFGSSHWSHNNITKILHKKPDLIDLMSVLSEIRSEWATIGTSLNVPDQGLLHLNISDLGKLNATLQVWIDGDGKYSPVCWETVLSAVEGPILNNERVSMRIRHYLRTDKIYEKYYNKDDFTIVGSTNNVKVIYSEEPELKDLMTVLVEIQSQWSTLGTALNVPEVMLPVTLQGVPNDVKLKATLQAWIDTRSSPVNWKTVIEAVGGPIINNERVARVIIRYLSQDEIFHKYYNKKGSYGVSTGNNILTIIDKKPDMIDLMYVLSQIQSQWFTLGTALNIPPNQGLLHQDIPISAKLNITLQLWLDGNGKYSPVTWKRVMEAVESPIVNNRRVGDEIRYYLMRDEIFHKYLTY